MKRSIILAMMAFSSFFVHAQSYGDLWKQVKKAASNDLPKTQVEVLDKIVEKASAELNYGQLLAAQLQRCGVQGSIAPDSLGVALDRLKQAAETAERSNPVLAAVYAACLGNVMSSVSAPNLEWNEEDAEVWKAKAMAHPDLLAVQKTDGYEPLVEQHQGSSVFGDDLLHVIGMETDNLEVMYDFYRQSGNREAACMSAALLLRHGKKNGSRIDKMAWIDRLLDEYKDLPVACELAIERLSLMEDKVPAEEQLRFIDRSLEQWGAWPHANDLRSHRASLLNPQFEAMVARSLIIPGKAQVVKLCNIRHMNEIKMTVSRVDVKGDTRLQLRYDDADYKKLVKLITQKDVQVISRTYADRKDYEVFDDSLTLGPLPVGTYLIDYYADGKHMKRLSDLLFVSNLYVMVEELPDNRVRYVSVDATTGQPRKGVHLRLTRGSHYGDRSNEKVLVTDDKGEAVYAYGDTRLPHLYAYTDDDQSFPETDFWTSYSYYDPEREGQQVRVYTDRSLYRPGQTVNVSAIVYHRDADGLTMKAVDKERVTFLLRDANYKTVAKQKVVTDSYGTVAAEMALPTDGLTGVFHVEARCGVSASATIRVEEYKRPTFQVEMPDYEKAYSRGDTIVVTGLAKSYAGVPVQGAKVKYKVTRRQAWWCWWFREAADDEVLDSGEAVTADDGSFQVKVPMVLPPEVDDDQDLRGLFYQFVVQAQVTDQGGETHEGRISLPLGTKAASLSCQLPEKLLNTDKPQVTFSLKNASGHDVDGEVTYQIDGGRKMQAKTHTAVALWDKALPTGRHRLTAVCGTEKLEQDFIVFSIDDKHPVVETHDWFYVSDSQFPRDGKPVYVQIGSSDPDQHIVYSVFAGNKLLESGAIDQSNALATRTYIYKEEYGDGLRLVFAWVKDGNFYRHETQIARPLPDKRLLLEWKTFRDRLIPGQQEEWTLTVKHPDGTPAKAQLLAAMYDQSLDQIYSHSWSFTLPFVQSIPSAQWLGVDVRALEVAYYAQIPYFKSGELSFSCFDTSCFDGFSYFYPSLGFVKVRGGRRAMYNRASADGLMAMQESMDMAPMAMAKAVVSLNAMDSVAAEEDAAEDASSSDGVQVRENLNETAFFYPRLLADADGNVAIKFVLPESLTTWKMMGLAHDEEMNHGMINAEVIGQKTVMVQPNMPRFVREGDAAQIAVRLINTSEKAVRGTARLELLDPATEKAVATMTKGYTIDANGTTNALFDVPVNRTLSSHTLLIARVTAVGDGYSDGEQHYLPVLPSQERVINTRPFTQHEPGTKRIDLKTLFPEGTTQRRLTVEYTNNPAWLMIQALPYVSDVNEKNAISLVSAYYANRLASHILHTSPSVKQTMEQWRREKGEETSLMSSLQKDQSLKELVLNETPWVMDAENERDQKQALMRFFDENQLNNQLTTALKELEKLQNADGSWSWWKGMEGNPYTTMSACMTLVRLNVMIGVQSETAKMIDKAFSFMDKEMAKEVKLLKEAARKGMKDLRPSELAVNYLYTYALDGRALSASAKSNKDYLVELIANKTTEMTIYGKARSAIILAKNGYVKKAQTYLQSIKEYSVYTEEMGRYFDTPKAYYSWFDYRIPTETAAIEALKTLTPNDRQTIEDMQRWLLQSKRTQAWDTPINSVNAIFAFAEQGNIRQLAESGEDAVLSLDGEPMELPKATAGMGYVKASVDNPSADVFTAEKTSSVTSWGALYAQFMQPVTDIEDATSGIQVKRELLKDGKPVTSLAVGDRITVRITLRADRDYDFVQVIDKRAACMEPVGQLSGYRWGYYCAPKDYTTNYYFDRLPKGTRVIETDYYVDRAGIYQQGTCTAQCAYAPEFTGRKKGERLEVENK